MFIFTIITAILAIILAAVGFYRISDRFTVGKRIEQIKIADTQTADEELAKPFIQRVLLPLGDYVAKLFRGYTPAEMAERTHKKLVQAGLFPRVTGVQLVGLCWFSASACVVIVFLVILARGGPGGSVSYTDPTNILLLL